MTSLRYVCLSDLHLGAEYSILTPIDEHGHAVDEVGDSALGPFAAALRAYVRRLSGSGRPTLALLGDVPDLSFSSTHVSAMAYRRFARALFPPDEEPVFDDRVIFLPGNHDHHLWRTLQDDHFLKRMREAGPGPIPPLTEVTRLLDAPNLESPFLTEILRDATGRETLTVMTAYPNLGLTTDDGSKCLVLHHGHFVESMYTAVSRLAAWLSGRKSIPGDVATIEAENGGWVDFFWSELGSAGVVGADTVKVYQILQDPAATHETTARTARRISRALLQRLPAGGMPVVRELTPKLTKASLDGMLGGFVSSERYAFDTVLSAGTLATLRWYLSAPVRQQLHEELGSVPDDVTFVFGHTHKPFEDLLLVDGYPALVKVFNTGGWVLDETRQPTTQGGAAVFIDDALDVASLRLFQASPAGVPMPVHVQGARGTRDPGAWVQAMREALDATQAEWGLFSAAADASLRLRSDVIFGRFFDPRRHPPVRVEAGA